MWFDNQEKEDSAGFADPVGDAVMAFAGAVITRPTCLPDLGEQGRHAAGVGLIMSDLSIQRDMRRQLAEKEFEETLRAYAIDTGTNMFGDGRKFQFGGAYNLISSVKMTFEKLAEEFDCEDYAKVAEELQKVELMADLPYWHPEDAE